MLIGMFLLGDCLPMDYVVKPLLILGFRLYVAQVFFMSGLSKIQTWSTTLMLFEYEYSVPLLSPKFAAILATAGELILPVMLVVGFFSRPAALALFILNYVAVISYADMSAAGYYQHVVLGAMLAVIFAFGSQALSVDKILSRRWQHQQAAPTD